MPPEADGRHPYQTPRSIRASPWRWSAAACPSARPTPAAGQRARSAALHGCSPPRPDHAAQSHSPVSGTAPLASHCARTQTAHRPHRTLHSPSRLPEASLAPSGPNAQACTTSRWPGAGQPRCAIPPRFGSTEWLRRPRRASVSAESALAGAPGRSWGGGGGAEGEIQHCRRAVGLGAGQGGTTRTTGTRPSRRAHVSRGAGCPRARSTRAHSGRGCRRPTPAPAHLAKKRPTRKEPRPTCYEAGLGGAQRGRVSRWESSRTGIARARARVRGAPPSRRSERVP